MRDPAPDALPDPAADANANVEDPAAEAVTAEDLGLAPGSRLPLRFTAGLDWSPVVVSFPHVGLAWPHDLRPKPQADFSRNADYQVQTLYPGLAELGVATVEAIYSRLVVDLNRAADDVSPQLVPDHPAPKPRTKPGSARTPEPNGWDRPGRGVVWASAVAAGVGAAVRILQPPLPYAAFAQRIDRYHRPYYRALELLLARRRERFGYAVLLDAHSMPGSVGVDLVLGTLDGASCHEAVAEAAYASLQGEPSGPVGAVVGAARLAVPRWRSGPAFRQTGRRLPRVAA